MLPADLPDVLVIERASFSMPWSRGAFLYEIEQNQVARCWVGREDGRVVGYICLWEVTDELHVTNVAVHPDARRHGFARALLESVFALAREDGRVVGYICLWEVTDELHVTNVAVHPDARRHGFARALLESVFAHARVAGSRIVLLEVRPSNTEAIPLYESFGFRVIGRRRGYYYDTGEDALVMEALVSVVEARVADSSQEPRIK